MDASKKKLTRILAVVGIGLLACGAKLWLDSNAQPAVIYANTDTSAGESSSLLTEVSIYPQVTAEPANPVDPENPVDDANPADPANSSDPAEGSIAAADPVHEEIPVYICGSVLNPGIYQIMPGSYLYEVVDMAGGLLPEAAADYMNLVFQFTGAVSIYIPSYEEMEAFLDGTDNSTSEYLRSGLLQGIWGSNPSEEGPAGVSPTAQDNESVNINTAGQSQLESLPGVGESMAKAIIAYREKSGGFTKIEDIMNVAGIKEGRFEAIREFITV